MRFGLWSEAGVPHKGWSCEGVTDLGAPDHVCEMCERQHVRYVHTMTHPEYAAPLDVGCVCAGKMEGDYEEARKRESAFKKRQKLINKWTRKGWNVSKNGNLYKKYKGIVFIIIENSGLYSFLVKEDGKEGYAASKKYWPTSADSMRATFDVAEDL